VCEVAEAAQRGARQVLGLVGIDRQARTQPLGLRLGDELAAAAVVAVPVAVAVAVIEAAVAVEKAGAEVAAAGAGPLQQTDFTR
jgi:hypothetical protein